MLFTKTLVLASIFGSVLSQVFVSDSPDKTDAVLLQYSDCLSGDKYIYLETDNLKIEKVTWYTKKNICDTVRYNKKTNYEVPFNFKGGDDTTPIPWTTTKVNDNDYVMYANVYEKGCIVERFRIPFCVCNDVECSFTSSPTASPSMSPSHIKYEMPTMKPTSCDDGDNADGGDNGDVGDDSGDSTFAPTVAPTSAPTVVPVDILK